MNLRLDDIAKNFNSIDRMVQSNIVILRNRLCKLNLDIDFRFNIVRWYDKAENHFKGNAVDIEDEYKILYDLLNENNCELLNKHRLFIIKKFSTKNIIHLQTSSRI